jgi:DNA-binding CsgD family transcriptional regulator
MNFLSLKMPWYDLSGDIIGFFGFGLMLGVHSMATGLQNILDTQLFMPTLQKHSLHLPIKAGQVYLTQREKEILYHAVRGNTARKTAEATNLSPRTIEHYLETLKMKFNVSNKTDLIAKAIDIYSFSKMIDDKK